MRIYKTTPSKKDSENTELVVILSKFVKLNGIQGKDKIHNRKKIIPAKVFQNENWQCRKDCMKNLNETERKRIRNVLELRRL